MCSILSLSLQLDSYWCTQQRLTHYFLTHRKKRDTSNVSDICLAPIKYKHKYTKMLDKQHSPSFKIKQLLAKTRNTEQATNGVSGAFVTIPNLITKTCTKYAYA